MGNTNKCESMARNAFKAQLKTSHVVQFTAKYSIWCDVTAKGKAATEFNSMSQLQNGSKISTKVYHVTMNTGPGLTLSSNLNLNAGSHMSSLAFKSARAGVTVTKADVSRSNVDVSQAPTDAEAMSMFSI